MRKETRDKLNNLNQDDVYSLLLFSLFRLKDEPKYSSLSELAYLLNGQSFFNLLEYYGGTTIKVPTLKEFNLLVQALLLYQFINIDNIEYNQAIKLVDTTLNSERDIQECYSEMVDILLDYDFHGRQQQS